MNTQAISQANLITGGELQEILGAWAGRSHGTLAQQLARALRHAIQSSALASGSRLPAERAIAEALAVSRSTVTAALDELRAEGSAVSRQGSGTFVRNRAAAARPATRIGELSLSPGIDLASCNPFDASHLPPVRLDVAALLAVGDGPALQPLGLPALRAALAAHMNAGGRVTDESQIHITSGAHQAIALALGAVAGRDTAVAVEDPSYPGLFDIIETIGAKPVPIRSDSAGLIPDELDRVLTDQQPAALYIQAGPHNPTGRVPTAGRLRALAEVLDRHTTTVIEDCTLAELNYAGRLRPELADLCRRAAVISLGSFSKVAWAGLRIGWMRADAPFIDRTMHLRLANDLGASVPSQLLALQLLPHLQDMAAARRASLEESAHRAVSLLRQELPAWKVTEPLGGYALWPELPVDDTAAFAAVARQYGVHVAAGRSATANRRADPHIRLCIDRPASTIDEALLRLRNAWRDFSSGNNVPLG